VEITSCENRVSFSFFENTATGNFEDMFEEFLKILNTRSISPPKTTRQYFLCTCAIFCAAGVGVWFLCRFAYSQQRFLDQKFWFYCEKQMVPSYAILKKDNKRLKAANKRLEAANKKLVAENAEIVAKNNEMQFKNEYLRAMIVDDILMVLPSCDEDPTSGEK
jgi:hypothetical protein